MRTRAEVLAIDDSPEIHLVLAARLKGEELTLHHSFAADDGMRKAIELQPDLILLDIGLSAESGLELCRQLKSDARTASLQIIFLSGATETATKVRGFELGAIDYITKPFEPAELRARVRSALRTKRLQDLLSIRAQVDGLTGLWNRGYFDQRLADEMAAARRHGRAVSLMMIDIDHFKSINDRFGHPFGDRVIQSLAEILTRSVRATDAACRFGGEEFAVILSETRLSAALPAARRIQQELTTYRPSPQGEPLTITASFGVCDTSGAPLEELTAACLLERTDEALYLAKRAGRDRIHS